MTRILVVEDDRDQRENLEWAARGPGREVVTVSNAKEALQRIEEEDFDIVVTDLFLETRQAGLHVLAAAKAKNAQTQVILCTAYGTWQISVEAMRQGAFDYLERNAPGTDVPRMIQHKIELAQRFRDAEVQCHKILGAPRLHGNWPRVFVAMPFAPALAPVYEDHITRAALVAGLDVRRAEDFFSVKSIMSDIWSAIHAAQIVVADCTGRNPNVLYEIGLAHAIGKNTILIAQSLDDVPFDLRHLHVIVYEYTPRGMTKFEAQLSKALTDSRSVGPS
jgi:CheY-like chemotaxis protein